MTEPAFHQLVPEDSQIAPEVPVEAVWLEVSKAIEASPAKDRLFASWAEQSAPSGQHGPRLRIEETAVAFMNLFVRNGLTPRINSGTRFYRLPAEAFIPRVNSGDGLADASAQTWTRGVLHRLDTTERYDWIADNRYRLLFTHEEAATIRERTHGIIAEEEREQRRHARDVILGRASRGEISPKEAEAEAERQGLEQLASRPSPDQFNPLERPAWTMPMALAWIAWRCMDEVREWDSDYRQESWEWVGPKVVRRKPATIWEFQCRGYLRRSEIERGAADRELDVDLPKRSKAELWRALQEGLLTANGIPGNGGPRRDVPALEWHDIEAYRDQHAGKECLRYRHEPHRGAVYTGVLLPRAQVLKVWPERQMVTSGSPNTVGAETRALTSLLDKAEHAIATGGPIPVGAAWRETCGLGPRPARRVWEKAVEKFPQLKSLNKPKRNRGA